MVTTLQGDVRETLKTLPSDSVHCVVTSPPYWAQRSYLPKDHALKPLEIGSEASLEQYLVTMVLVFREVRRVLHPSGTLWLNVGSSYASASTRSNRVRHTENAPACGNDGKELQGSQETGCACYGRDGECQDGSLNRHHRTEHSNRQPELSDVPDGMRGRGNVNAGCDAASLPASSVAAQPSTIGASILNAPGASCREDQALAHPTAEGSSPSDAPLSAHKEQNTGGTLSQLRTLVDHIEDKESLDLALAYCSIVSRAVKEKDLINQPSMIAEALRLDGWFIRSDIAYCKKSPMPESVTDRPTSAWEHVWLLSKSAKYFWDAEAVKEPSEGTWNGQERGVCKQTSAPKGVRSNGTFATTEAVSSRNLRNFWLLGPEQFRGAHFATFPSEIPKRAILAGSSARGCCPKCLAPWERVIERSRGMDRTRDDDEGLPEHMNAHGIRKLSGPSHAEWKLRNPDRYLGWQPTCTCDAGDPIPCTVLDPFAGTGCTLMVAIQLGRRAIGCELNPDYVTMIRDRTNVTPGLQLA